MGFDKKLFVSRVDADYLCGVCSQVADSPKTCEKCEKLFCTECTDQKKGNSDKCPKCNLPDKTLIKAHKIILQNIQKLQLKCQDCQQILTLQEYKPHIENECINSKQSCPNKEFGCEFQMSKSQIIDHFNHCSYKKLECDQCQGQIFKFQQNDHNCFQLIKDIIERQTQNLQDILLDQNEKQETLKKVFTNQQLNSKQVIKIGDQIKKQTAEQSLILEKIDSFQALINITKKEVNSYFEEVYSKKMEEGNTLFSQSTLSYTRTPIIKIKLNQHENRAKHDNEIQTYDSERNVLTNDNKFIRTFPACLSPDQKHNKGFSGTPELFRTNQLEYFKKVLEQYQKGQVKEQNSYPKSKTSRTYSSPKKRDNFLNPKQQDKSQNKSQQEQDETKGQKSEQISQRLPNQRNYQEQKQPQTLRYQDYKQLHHEQRKLYLYKRSQPPAFTQKSQLSEINASSKASLKDIEFQYFKPKNVRLSQKSAIRLYAPDKEKKSKFHICPDNLQVQKTSNENNQNYIYKQHLIRSLNPKYPPILATEATNSNKLNNILCNVQQTNLKTLQENILKTIKNTPKNKLTLGDRILLLTLLEEKQHEYLNDKGQIFSI